MEEHLQPPPPIQIDLTLTPPELMASILGGQLTDEHLSQIPRLGVAFPVTIPEQNSLVVAAKARNASERELIRLAIPNDANWFISGETIQITRQELSTRPNNDPLLFYWDFAIDFENMWARVDVGDYIKFIYDILDSGAVFGFQLSNTDTPERQVEIRKLIATTFGAPIYSREYVLLNDNSTGNVYLHRKPQKQDWERDPGEQTEEPERVEEKTKVFQEA